MNLSSAVLLPLDSHPQVACYLVDMMIIIVMYGIHLNVKELVFYLLTITEYLAWESLVMVWPFVRAVGMLL